MSSESDGLKEAAARAGVARCRPCARWPGPSSASAARPTMSRTCSKLNPVHVIVAGVIGAALFVLALVLLVQLGHRQRRRRLSVQD